MMLTAITMMKRRRRALLFCLPVNCSTCLSSGNAPSDGFFSTSIATTFCIRGTLCNRHVLHSNDTFAYLDARIVISYHNTTMREERPHYSAGDILVRLSKYAW